jgi:proprotein convertase subtilisin/kexin type 5
MKASSTNCLTCTNIFYQNTCYSSCPASTYPTIINSVSTCEICDDSCLSCSGSLSTNCLTCVSGSYLTSTNTCATCSTNCLTCTSTSTQCISCPATLPYLYNNSCVFSCPSYYFNIIKY